MLNLNSDQFCATILENYRKINLDGVQIIVKSSNSVSIQTRNVKLENIERSKNSSIGINIFKDKRKATLTSNNIENADAKKFLEKGSAMVKSIPVDEFSG